MIRIFYLRKRRLQITLDSRDRIIGLRKSDRHKPDAVAIDKLAITCGDQLCLDGTLYVNAKGLMTLITWITSTIANPTGRSIFDHLADYFPGEPWLNEMIRATIRAGLGIEHAPGEAQLWLDAARLSLAEPTELENVASCCSDKVVLLVG